jgi:hypothetical protein
VKIGARFRDTPSEARLVFERLADKTKRLGIPVGSMARGGE